MTATASPRTGWARRIVDSKPFPAVVAALVLVAASGGLFAALRPGPAKMTAYADFDDVSDLTVGAPVQMADVAVGSVAAITLDGTRARVRMNLDRRVPADVAASVQRTTVLGEEVVELTGGHPGGAVLADGATIADTSVVPGLEQLVKGGSAVFGSIGANQLGVLVQAGAQGFGQSGASLRHLLDGFGTVLTAYSGQDATIRSLITSLDQLSSATAPDAAGAAQSITNLANTTKVLADQSARFDSLLTSLDNLSSQGRSILESFTPQISTELTAVRTTTAALAKEQTDLANLMRYLPGHAKTMSSINEGPFVQLLIDLEVCGVPGGGDTGTAVSNCYLAGPPGK